MANSKSVADLHAAMRAYPGRLSFLSAADPQFIGESLDLLDKFPGLLGAAELDRARREWQVLEPFVRSRTAFEAAFPGIELQPIHGDSPPANIFSGVDGDLYSDFELVTLGPVEWDLAALGPVHESAYNRGAQRNGTRPLNEDVLGFVNAVGMLRTIAALTLTPQLPELAGYLKPGVRLRSAGHEVTLATHERFEQAVTAHGLGFRVLPVDPRQELASQVGQGLARAVSPPVAMARVARMARAFMPRLTRGVADAVRQGADVVLSSTVTDPMCAALGEALGLPSIGVYLQPVQPTGAFPPMLTGGRSFGSHGNRLAAYALWAGTDHIFAPAVGALRRELGLPRRRFGGMLGLPHGRDVLHGFSPRVVPRPTDWPQGHEVCGYWWPQPPPGWEPDPRLLDFLDAGPPPCLQTP
ncbi:hypothetical protein AB0O76_42260 [Streptomyces sp. NPDC086554]|uniref:hypothetical protein n=1 Tax=Streptomyces sp. NPDC086554 TaxID=3154864 RepID=UPI00343B3F8E